MLVLVALVALAPRSPGVAQDGPAISVDPTAGPAGLGIVISGSGFAGECGVQLWFGDPADERFLGLAAPDEFGSFQLETTVPADVEPGEYVINAFGLEFGVEFCGGRSGTEARTPFTVTGDSGELEPRFVPEKPFFEGELGEGFSRTEIHLKFHQGTSVRLDDGEFISLGDDDLTALYDVLAEYPEVIPSRLFSARSEEALAREKARLEAKSGREQGDKNLYFLLSLPEETDEVALLNALNALEIVEIAYPVPLEGVDPIHDDYQDMQGYRTAATSGIHADAANTVPGGSGENVQIIDVERFFNPDHEDLPAVTVYENGDIDDAFDPPYDHGTAVLGEIFGVDNGGGVLGIAHEADAGFVSSAGGRANAIDIAAANSDPGDVILLELQRGGPNGPCSNASNPPQFGCVPEEFVQASYDAIVAAVADGIIVVAAAGNGRQDLDAEEYDDTFGTRPDSGAIIVGAGAAGDDDGCTNPERGRLVFSNFGSRVNLQGWGECVTTLGYGGLEGGSDTNDAYTAGFSGTSSASPIVAASAAIVSSVAIEQGDADGLSSTEARALLVATGTPQDTSAAALDGNIGPLPNLAAALGLEADLIVTKEAEPEPVAAGESLTYTITVTNDGPNVASDVTLLDDIPSEVSLVSFDPACSIELSGGLLCDLGDLAANTSVEIEIVVDIPPGLVFDAGSPVTITNTATASSTINDPVAGNHADSVDSTVVAVADLEVVDTEVLSVPSEALIGQDFDVTVRSTVRNLGPSSPIDAELETTGTPSAGASVSPASDTAAVDALVLNSPRVVEQAFTVSCEEPGPQDVTFDVEISPANAEDTDHNAANNLGQATATVECVVPVAINLRPGNQFNRVNLNGNAIITVAALTTEVGEYGLPTAFDATAIVPESVRFGERTVVWTETGGAAYHNGIFHILDSFEPDDRTKDGDDDMRFHFRSSQMGLSAGDIEACMKGQYMDGGSLYTFFGCDFIETQP